jgi:hypothetical protein
LPPHVGGRNRRFVCQRVAQCEQSLGHVEYDLDTGEIHATVVYHALDLA